MTYSTMTESDLLIAWQRGDRRAGDELLTRHHQRIALFFQRKLGADTDDLVQATFLGLLEAIPRFRGEASFRTFLFAIAHKQLLKHLRNRYRDSERFDPAEISIAAVDPTPSAVVAIRDQNKLLLAALRRLPIETQAMLELHYWEHLSIQQIAEVFEMPINTVKTRMHRGRRQLVDEMEQLTHSKQLLESTLGGLEDWAAKLERDLEDNSHE